MRLSHLFPLDSMILSMPPHSWKGAIKELLQRLARAGRLADVEEARRDVESREVLGSTALGRGVAVPHAATAGVNQPLIAYGRCKKGINFHAADQHPVHHVFLLLGPPARQSLHLRILARLTRLLAQAAFRDALEQASTPEEVLGAVQQYVGDFDEFEEPAGLPKVLVVGQNAYAIAMAAQIALLGSRVSLWGLDNRPLETIRMMRGITVEGAISGFAQFAQVGGALGEAIAGADLVMLAPPATDHARLPELLAPQLREGQAIVLHPGRVGGCLAFAARLSALGYAPPVYLAEAQTIPYECELPGPAVLRVHRVHHAIPRGDAARFPAGPPCRYFVGGAAVLTVGSKRLAVGLGNAATFFEPAVMPLNPWVERRRARSFRRDGASPQTDES
ncbi:PTS sugar transporter subunit IIA [bacterium]|nr:PTS sugar transporter subunit IIA [bacterium]